MTPPVVSSADVATADVATADVGTADVATADVDTVSAEQRATTINAVASKIAERLASMSTPEPAGNRASRRAARATARVAAAPTAGFGADVVGARLAGYADEVEQSLASDMKKMVGATSSAPYLYVVVDGHGFVGAFLSLVSAVELVHKRFAPLPFVVMRFPTAPGPVDTVHVVVMAANDAVLFVSNSIQAAYRVNAAYNSIGIALEDSAAYLRAPAGCVCASAERRLEAHLDIMKEFAADARHKVKAEIDFEKSSQLEQIIREAGTVPAFPSSRHITVIDAVEPFYILPPAATGGAATSGEATSDDTAGGDTAGDDTAGDDTDGDDTKMRDDETVDDWLDRILDAIPADLAAAWECGAAAEEAKTVFALGDRIEAESAAAAATAANETTETANADAASKSTSAAAVIASESTDATTIIETGLTSCTCSTPIGNCCSAPIGTGCTSTSDCASRTSLAGDCCGNIE